MQRYPASQTKGLCYGNLGTQDLSYEPSVGPFLSQWRVTVPGRSSVEFGGTGWVRFTQAWRAVGLGVAIVTRQVG